MKKNGLSHDDSSMDGAQRVAYLIAGFLQQTLSESEHDELDEWVGASDENMQLFEKLTDKDNIEQSLKEIKGYDTERAIQRIKQRIHFNEPATTIKQRFHFGPYMIAASVIAVIFIAGFFVINYFNKGKNSIQPVVQNQDLLPGGNKATLRLSDGSLVNLSDAKNGLVKNEDGTTILKTTDGQIAYESSGKDGIETKYNTLVTPKGGQYMVVLPDGTKVWLNAASSLKYPVAFNSNERLVELTGEGYFEVRPHPQPLSTSGEGEKTPFIVKLKNGAEVEVLGTHFNIMAYDDEINIETTLLEGSVTVISNNKSINIQPGQQAAIQKNGAIELNKEVNTDEVVAWKNGVFKFKDALIESVMRQVARWYDVDIVYDGTIGYHFNATIPRDVPVSKLFHLLEMTNRVHFEIEGKKIIVRP